MSLHYYGKSKEGVSKWGGGWSGIPTWFMVLFYSLSAVLGLMGLFLIATGGGKTSGRFAGLLLLGESAMFFAITKWAASFQKRLNPLKSLEQIGSEMNLSPAEIRSLAHDQGVKPRIILNEVARYHPDDLIAARVLVRASHKPSEVDNLLIPMSHPTDSDSSTLLKPVGTED